MSSRCLSALTEMKNGASESKTNYFFYAETFRILNRQRCLSLLKEADSCCELAHSRLQTLLSVTVEQD